MNGFTGSTALAIELYAARQTISELREQLAQARKDTERLDKLEALFKASGIWDHVCLGTQPDEVSLNACYRNAVGVADVDVIAPTIREAIDVARGAEVGTEKK